jgi:hypothetical protein
MVTVLETKASIFSSHFYHFITAAFLWKAAESALSKNRVA